MSDILGAYQVKTTPASSFAWVIELVGNLGISTILKPKCDVGELLTDNYQPKERIAVVGERFIIKDYFPDCADLPENTYLELIGVGEKHEVRSLLSSSKLCWYKGGIKYDFSRTAMTYWTPSPGHESRFKIKGEEINVLKVRANPVGGIVCNQQDVNGFHRIKEEFSNAYDNLDQLWIIYTGQEPSFDSIRDFTES